MSVYDQTLGALLIGTWFNAMFYMLELDQAYKFFTRFRRDRALVRGIVVFNLIVDTLGTANNCACIYLYTITHWGDASYLLVQNWAVPSYVVLSGLSACTVQLFLTYRFWVLSKNKFVTPFLVLFALASLGGAIANAIMVVKHSTYAERNFNIKTVTIWLGGLPLLIIALASAVADISIALSLVWKLQTQNTTFAQTKNLIHRLTFAAVQTGSVTSALAVLCRELASRTLCLVPSQSADPVPTIQVILYLINTQSNITVGFGFCLGRVYTLTMMFNLNSRTRGRYGNPSETESASTRREGDGYRLRDLHGTDIGAISVHRTAIVRIDGEEDAATGYYEHPKEHGGADRKDAIDMRV